MRIVKYFLIFTMTALFIWACNNTQTAPNTNKTTANNNTENTAKPENKISFAPDELAEAKKVYSEKCARCHKEDGTGGPTTIDGQKIKAANLNSDHVGKHSDDQLFDDIKNGITDENMPAFKKQLSDDQIKDLVKFIRKEFQK